MIGAWVLVAIVVYWVAAWAILLWVFWSVIRGHQ